MVLDATDTAVVVEVVLDVDLDVVDDDDDDVLCPVKLENSCGKNM